MRKNSLLLACGLLLFASCGREAGAQKDALKIKETTRIVSLNGTLTEILCGLGYERNIAGVDVTSTYPEAMLGKPKVGHNRNLSPEAIVALKPDVVVGVKEFMPPGLVDQLTAAHARTIIFDPAYSVEGAKQLIQTVADSLHNTGHAAQMVQQIDNDRKQATVLTTKPKVLFIYARGAGTLMAAGTNTPVHSMIGLAGAVNAVTGYENFKPLTTEALVAVNPDVILLFDSGLSSLGGIKGLLQIPGVLQTEAGKNKRVIEMDGLLLTGFGPRTGQAIAELSKKLNEAVTH